MTAGRESIVDVCGVSRTYLTPTGQVEALRGVDAQFRAAQIAVVVGVSGSGKSSLLRIVAGLDPPSGGRVLVGGRELAGASARALRLHRRDVAAYMSQRPGDNFVSHLTLSRQVGHGNRAPLAALGLESRLDATPLQLSGGEQARAAFALAISRRTPIVIADEPTAELDRASASLLLATILEYTANGVTFVIATHDDELVAIAHSVLRLDSGNVVDATVTAPPAVAVKAEPGTEKVLAAHGVSKRYGRGPLTVEALTGATLDLRRGELAALLGRSGSGKSTMIALLARLQQPDEGTITYTTSAPANGDPPRWSDVALLPQRFGLIPELPLRENIELPLKLGHRLPTRQQRTNDLLERFGLTDLADRFPHETSIGQQQRAALARALVGEPSVLLADEPTSHQDTRWRRTIWETLVDAATAGTACLVATHEHGITSYARRVWTIDSGVVTAPRPPEK